MDETVSKFEKITSKLEEKLAPEIQEMARSLNTTTHQVELLTQRLRDTEKDMLDMKKRSSDRERKIEELTLELDRQQIFSRRDNVVFYGIPEVQDGAEDCVRALAELINSHSYSERVWSEDDFDRAHRLGRASSTKTRPVIAKLHRSRDKRALIANKSLTKDLAKVGVRLSDDHTTKQRTVLKELRRQGLTAYFRGARLISRPGPKSDTRHQAAPEDLDTLQRSSDEEHQSSATLPDAVHRLCDGPAKDQRSSGHRPTDHHSPDHRSPDHRSTDHHSTDRRSTDCQSPGHRSFDHHSQDHRSTDHRSPDHRSTDPVPRIIVPLTTVPPTTVPLTAVPLIPVPLTTIPTTVPLTTVPLIPVPLTTIPRITVSLTAASRTIVPLPATPLAAIPPTRTDLQVIITRARRRLQVPTDLAAEPRHLAERS